MLIINGAYKKHDPAITRMVEQKNKRTVKGVDFFKL